VLADGLNRVDSSFVWQGKTYAWLTDKMMAAMDLLHKAHSEERKVTPDEMKNIIGSIPMDGLKRIFRIDRIGYPMVHPIAGIVGGRANTGWYLKRNKILET